MNAQKSSKKKGHMYTVQRLSLFATLFIGSLFESIFIHSPNLSSWRNLLSLQKNLKVYKALAKIFKQWVTLQKWPYAFIK